MNKEKLIRQHFVGQVADKIGMDETIEMLKASKKAVERFGVEDVTDKCKGCPESTGETKLFCCNHCGKRTEEF